MIDYYSGYFAICNLFVSVICIYSNLSIYVFFAAETHFVCVCVCVCVCGARARACVCIFSFVSTIL